MMTPDLQSTFPDFYRLSLVLYDNMKPIALVILSFGLTYRIFRGIFGDVGEMLRGLMTTGILVALIAVFPRLVNDFQLVVYEYVEAIGGDPSKAAERYTEVVAEVKQERNSEKSLWSVLWSVDAGIGEALTYASLYLISMLARCIMFLFFIIQQGLLIYGIAVAPLFISFFSVDGLRRVAGKYMMSLACIALWPLGWSFSDVITERLIEIMAENSGFLGSQSYFLTLATSIWIIFSSISAPLLINKVLVKGQTLGVAVLGTAANAVAQMISYGISGGATTFTSGGSASGIKASTVLSSTAGYAMGAAGYSSPLLPVYMGAGVGLATGKRPSGNYNEQAAQFDKQYK